MTPEEKLRAKRWNERLRLWTTFLNVTAIGSFGLGFVTPILALFSIRAVPIGSADSLDAHMTEISRAWYDVVLWPVVGLALLLHVLAHISLSLLESEE